MKQIEVAEQKLYSLLPLNDFKALLGIDDREDKLARFCLVTATFAIEQYCMRRFLRKKYIERRPYLENLFFPLNEYPVSKVVSVYGWSKDEIIKPEYYEVIPDCGTEYDVPSYITFSPALNGYRKFRTVKVDYWAGYVVNPLPCGFTTQSFCDAKTQAKAKKTAASMPPVPADLATACIELAFWNMNRYRGRRIGVTGNNRVNGKDGEHLEMSMPENVKSLLEPYRRKTL